MAFTFTQKDAPANPESLFGGLPNDGNRVAMTGIVGSGPQTQDASSTPLVSPLTVSNTSVTTLEIPKNAAQLLVATTTNTINISESDSTVTTNYFTLPTGVFHEIDVSRCKYLYLEANTGNATVSFYFNVV